MTEVSVVPVETVDLTGNAIHKAEEALLLAEESIVPIS